jgi:probable rRNA maturation factor
VSVEINNESGVQVDEARVLALATHALDYMNIHPDADLAIQFADEHVMEKLHIEFMDEPGPTDVLSFPMDELKPGTPESPTPAGLLGDIVVCPTVAAAQALTAGHQAIEEILLLTTHGILHLLGYDHAEPDEEREMFGLQRQILETFYKAEASQ